jgi:Family of unknown function (DUF5947)
MTSRLLELARQGSEPRRPAADEHCELCSEPIGPGHRHVLDLSSRELLCACRACSLLFDRPAAGGDHYRLVPARRVELRGFRLDDALWDALRIPVDMAFFFHDSAAGRVVAYYPGPMGATESLLDLADWRRLEDENPVLAEMEADVQALLVNRAGGACEHWLVGLDDCYALVGVMRTRWKGLGGGSEVWQEIDRFFAGLRAGDRKEATWPT